VEIQVKKTGVEVFVLQDTVSYECAGRRERERER
jgi:hypothetical protein